MPAHPDTGILSVRVAPKPAPNGVRMEVPARPNPILHLLETLTPEEAAILDYMAERDRAEPDDPDDLAPRPSAPTPAPTALK